MSNFGVYIFNETGIHKGATWFPTVEDALVLFVEACRMREPRVMICDAGDKAVAEAANGMVSYARWALIQAPGPRRKILDPVLLDERECAFCKEVFLPSRRPEEGELWEREQHMSGCCSDACWERSMGAAKTVRFRVELVPFGDRAIREVKIPAKLVKGLEAPRLRQLIFEWGQNDKQHQALPSVCVGDIIWLNAEPWRVIPDGFEPLHPKPVAQEAFLYDDRDQT